MQSAQHAHDEARGRDRGPRRRRETAGLSGALADLAAAGLDNLSSTVSAGLDGLLGTGAAPGAQQPTLAERAYRARRVGTTFGRIYLGIKSLQLLERTIAPGDIRRRWSRHHTESAHAIYETAIELRGLILKGCQFLGSRADLLPPEYLEVLSRLQDEVPARPAAVARSIVERELRAPLEEIFSEFEPEPVAAASLAQVHRARLANGTEVAVKIQYPEIPELLRGDVANLRTLFRAVGLLEREVDFMPFIEELATHVPEELDFLAEARNAERIADFFRDRDDIHVPRIHWRWSTPRVLVMDYVHGLKIGDRPALEAAGVDRSALYRTVVEAYGEQILRRGFFHADPHPGNLLVEPRAAGAVLVFLDFGLAKRLPADFRQGVQGFVAALFRSDSQAMAGALLDMGFETRDGGRDSLEAITAIVLEVATEVRARGAFDPERMREASRDLPRLVRENPIVRMPTHIVLLGRVLGLLSGLGRTLDARIDLLKVILPYVLTPPQARVAPPPQAHAPDPPQAHAPDPPRAPDEPEAGADGESGEPPAA